MSFLHCFMKDNLFYFLWKMVCEAASEKCRLVFSPDSIFLGLGEKRWINEVFRNGDTRFDRVKQLRERNNHVDFIADFKGESKAVVLEVHGRQKRK